MGARYFVLKAVEGPAEQIGVVVKTNLAGGLEELTEFIQFDKLSDRVYVADTNVNLYGKSNGKPDNIELRVTKRGVVKISKNAEYPMSVAEITKTEADDRVARSRAAHAAARAPRFRFIAPENSSMGFPSVDFEF